MPIIVRERALAYILRGHWVAECPAGCGQCQYLFKGHSPDEKAACPCMAGAREAAWYCQECGQLAELEWPPDDDMAAFWQVLAPRPRRNRNWYPAEHMTAVKFRKPHGQTVDDMRDENTAHGVI